MPQKQQQGDDSKRTTFNVVYAGALGWAWCFYPALRCNMGKNAIGMRGIAAFVVMWLYTTFSRCPEMCPFFGLWLVFIILQRLCTFQVLRRGGQMHSQYQGDLLVMRVFRGIKRPFTGKMLEVVLIGLWGVGMYSDSHGLGRFMMIGAFCMFLVAIIDELAKENRVTAMRDAEIEQRYMAEIHRGERMYY